MENTNFQREVLDRLIKLETLLQQQDYKALNEKVDIAHDSIIKDEKTIENHDERIKKIEDNNRWLWRTVIGALILGALAILFGI